MRTFLSVVLMGAAACMQSGGQPVNIPIPNPSFDLGYGQSNSQDLGVTPAHLQADPAHPGYFIDGVYQFSVDIINDSGPYPGYFQGQISFGTQELCPVEGWGTRNVTHVIVVCGGPVYIVADQALPGGGPVQGTKDLVLSLSVPGWSISFKNASLTFTRQ